MTTKFEIGKEYVGRRIDPFRERMRMKVVDIKDGYIKYYHVDVGPDYWTSGSIELMQMVWVSENPEPGKSC